MKIKKEDDQEINRAPNIFWQKYLDKFPEIETLPVEEWKVLHLVAYFCKRYKDHYGVSYSLKFNTTAPSSSYETFQFRRIGQVISTDPVILKDYIDWFFQFKIILKKKRITSLSFLSDTNICNEFKAKKYVFDTSKNIERETILPPNILHLSRSLQIAITTYGELAFLSKIIGSDMANDTEKLLFTELANIGFDFAILEKVR